MLNEETYFKLKWLIAKNELANIRKQGSINYQKPCSNTILDLHARVSGIHKGLDAVRNNKIQDWIDSLKINLIEIDRWQPTFNTASLPDIGINWHEYETTALTNTMSTVYEFLHTHKKRRPIVFKNDYWYFQEIIENKIEHYNNIDQNDVLIISAPFFEDFQIKNDMNKILETCSNLSVPVLLDLIWLPLINNVKKLENIDCIEVITHSITKTLPIAGLKGGVCFRRKPVSKNLKTYPLGNKLGLWIFNQYVNNLSYYHVKNQLINLQKKWCELFGLEVYDFVYVGKNQKNNYFKKYSIHDGQIKDNNLISLVPFYNNDEILTKYLNDN